MEIFIKIPQKLHLDLSLKRLGRLKIFSKFIFLCPQNMVSVQRVEFIILPLISHLTLAWDPINLNL